MFCTPRESMNRKYHVFNGSREINDVYSEYLECKLPEVKYFRRIVKLKWQKTLERRYL